MLRSTRSRFAILAALTLGAGLSPTAALAAGSGGAVGPDTAPGGPNADQPPAPVVAANGFVLDARRAAIVRRIHRVRGRVPAGAAGRTVSVQRLDAEDGWVEVAEARAAADGAFLTSWRARSLGRVQLRAALASSSASGATAEASPTLLVTVYKSARATWFGPGFYGRRTACGVKLTKTTLGVAHRRLRCGTQVAVSYGGLSIVVPVIDRGPYRDGVDWDLTRTTADQLGADGIFKIGAVALIPGR